MTRLTADGSDLILILRPPFVAARGREHAPGVYNLRSEDYYVGDSAWAGMPVFLVDAGHDRWVGLSYNMPLNRLHELEAFSLDWDGASFSISSSGPSKDHARIDHGRLLLDISWENNSSRNVERRVAQLDLSVVTWLWDEGHEAPAGVVVFDVDDVTSEYSLLI